jgi:sugar-specific transcriptional regulator TrmB
MPDDPENGDANEGQSWGRMIRPQPAEWWTKLAEERLTSLNQQVRELRSEFKKLQEKQSTSEASSRENGWAIKRVEEMLASMDDRLKSIQDLIPDKRRAELVEKVVFGLVGLILVAVVGLWLKTIGIGR